MNLTFLCSTLAKGVDEGDELLRGIKKAVEAELRSGDRRETVMFGKQLSSLLDEQAVRLKAISSQADAAIKRQEAEMKRLLDVAKKAAEKKAANDAKKKS